MRYFFAFILLIHGLIHLMGFVKAFKYAEISQLTQPISKGAGLIWLLAGLLFLTTTLLFLLQKEAWWMVAVLAVVVSQGLLFTSWQDAKFGTIANVIALLGIIMAFGTWRFQHQYIGDVNKGLKDAASIPISVLNASDLQGLPAPVRKYIEFSGAIGKPKVNYFKIKFNGKIRKNEQSEWMPFTSEQYNFMEPATRLFFMDATMKRFPVAGFHRFSAGEAMMDIRLFSLIPVQYASGPEMNIAETVTFFNDMCCMAPATLIDPRIQWLEVAENKVKASFTNQGITITAWLFFDAQGALVNFTSADRFASMEDNTLKQIPWSTPLKDYKPFNGHLLNSYAETIYTYPSGDFCYGTFQLTEVEYH